MASQHTHAIAWQPDLQQGRIDFAHKDDLSPVRGVLIGLAISAVLWVAIGSGLWVGLTLIGVSS